MAVTQALLFSIQHSRICTHGIQRFDCHHIALLRIRSTMAYAGNRSIIMKKELLMFFLGVCFGGLCLTLFAGFNTRTIRSVTEPSTTMCAQAIRALQEQSSINEKEASRPEIT